MARVECNCPYYLFVKVNTHTRKNVSLPYARLVGWAAAPWTQNFADDAWLHGGVEVHHTDDALTEDPDDATRRLKMDADPTLLLACTPKEHKALEAA